MANKVRGGGGGNEGLRLFEKLKKVGKYLGCGPKRYVHPVCPIAVDMVSFVWFALSSPLRVVFAATIAWPPLLLVLHMVC